MVLTLAIPIRAVYGLEDFITMRHLQNMAKIMLVTGLIVAYGYMHRGLHVVVQRRHVRALHDLESDDRPVRAGVLDADPLQHRHPTGAVVQARPDERAGALRHRARRQRRHVAGALRHRRDEPASRFPALGVGQCTAPTFWDWATFVGTIGLFLSLLFLFLRFLPMISIAEMRAILPAAKVDEGLGM